jgi:hypothetical protein
VARPHRWFGALVVALTVLVWLAPSVNAQVRHPRAGNLDLRQCANGTSGIGQCVTTGGNLGWVSGDLNQNNSLYREGDFVPFRLVVTGLVAGQSYTQGIGYDAVDKSLHTYDYLGTYDASENWPGPPAPQVVPCGGVGDTAGPFACGNVRRKAHRKAVRNAPSTLAVPTDPYTNFPSGSSQAAGHFSAWGATLTGATYDSSLNTPIGVNNSGTIERGINLTFTANGPTAVIAWGGHLASVLDWGQGNTFKSGGASGASFHMRLTTGGNEELSINVNAIAAQPLAFTTRATPASVQLGQPVTDTATLTGLPGVPVTGDIQFFVCGPSSTPPDCTQGGTAIDPGVAVLARARQSSTGTASIVFVPTETGNYCFRAEYTPSTDAPYSPALHTDTTTECFVATDPPTQLTVTKLCVVPSPPPDPGLFNIIVTPGFDFPDTPCGMSHGPFDVAPGTYTVSETAGTGTSLGNYEQPPTFGADCPAGLVTLATGESKTCTITNVALGEQFGFLDVTKECDPTTEDQFAILLDTAQFANLSCGQSTGAIKVATGSHTVSEVGVPPASLSDYDTAISGDCNAETGAVTVVANQTAHCTFTNKLIPPTTTLEVRKACVPAEDDGHFKLLIETADGKPVKRHVVTCGGTTGAVPVQPGSYRVRERGANGTDLSQYNRYIGHDCQSDGTVTLQAGDNAVCTIVNVHKGTPSAELTVTKVCVPADDGGLFNLTIDTQTGQDVPCGGSFGPVAVAPGQHHVGESAGTGTSLSDYTTTIGGDCAPTGAVTLAAGQQATCSITNVRSGGQTGTVEIVKQCSPAGTTGHFQLVLDGQVFRGIACGETTGVVTIGVGDHQIAEVGVPGQTSRFETTISGGCSATGAFTVTAGQHVTCVVTNTLVSPMPPLKPPPACYTLSVSPRVVRVGGLVRVLTRVHLGRRPVPGVRVYVVGPGVSLVRTTGSSGQTAFVFSPQSRGFLHVSIRKAFDCPKRPPKKIGVLGAATPPVTG